MTDDELQDTPNILFESIQHEGQVVNNVADAESSSTPRTNLIDLPNEIIVNILGEVEDDDDIYRIAFLSRRFNYLALPIYLARRRFGSRRNDRLVLYDYNSLDILKALDVALFKSPLTRLHFPFDCDKPLDQLERELRSLRGILDDKLSSLQEVAVDFQNATRILPEPLLLVQALPENTGNPRPFIIPNEALGDFISLLDSIITCGCEILKFSHSGPQTTAMYDINVAISEEFGGTKDVVKICAGVRTVSSALLSLFIGSCWPSINSKKAKSSLKTLYLHSPISFHSHLARWTIKALNDSALHTLSVSQQSSVDKYSWALILPCITIPTLANLTLDSCSLRLRDLLMFLKRHTALQTLKLGQSFALSDIIAPRQRVLASTRGPQLRLTHITVPLDRLIKLFDFIPHLFTPSLYCLTILLRVPHGMHFSLGMLDQPLKAYIRFIKPMKEVHLSLSFGDVPSSTWIAVNPVVGYEPDMDGNEDGPHCLITHLDVHVQVYYLPFSLVTRLQELLVRFPALTQLTIKSLAGINFLDVFQKRRFGEVVQQSCPMLDSVCFV